MSDDGSHWYLTGWQLQRIDSALGCTTYVPQMKGWGGNTVTVLPGGVTLIRMRNCRDEEDGRIPQVAINALADRLARVGDDTE